jgi:hypothetical protein
MLPLSTGQSPEKNPPKKGGDSVFARSRRSTLSICGPPPMKLATIVAINKPNYDVCQRTYAQIPTSVPVSQSAQVPNRQELASQMDMYDESNYSTNFKQSMKTVVIQSYSHRLAEKHSGDKVNSETTPRTKNFLLSAAHLEVVGSKSIVSNRDMLLREAADVYLGRTYVAQSQMNANPRTLLPVGHTKEIPLSLGYVRGKDGTSLFGGDLPSNAEKHSRTSEWDRTPTQEWPNFANAVVQPGYGPNAKVVKTDSTLNGFHTREYGCKHKKKRTECAFQGRIFYPLPDDVEYFCNSRGEYEKIDRHSGPVLLQTIQRHSCGVCISWKDHLDNPQSKGGLHAVLKDSVDREGGMDPYNLLAPDMMYQQMLDLYSDEVDTLFPHGSKTVVMNQIRSYWTRERKRILTKRQGHFVEVKYLTDIKVFREKHTLKLSTNYQPTSNFDTIQQARSLAEMIEKDGTKTLRHNAKASPSGELAYTPEHETFCLPLPTSDDIDFGHIIQKAREKDAVSLGSAENHFVAFSSINLLRQATIAKKKYDNHLMACIDSTHGGDSNGGKLMSFGYVSFDKPGHQGSKYRHTYVPLVFSRVKEENEESALLMLAALGHTIRLLFGLTLDIKGGLISDHAQSFVNAYKTFFPHRPRGQCFPHVLMKFKDQSGRRKRGSPGYLRYIKDQKYFKVASKDVRQMHKCVSSRMKEKYTAMCLEAWKMDGEEEMAGVFYKSYVQSKDHSQFWYNEFGNPGDSPQCNSLE